VLPGLLSGTAVAAWCGAEHAIGASGPGLRAVVRDSSVELSGVCTPVEAASHADHLLVTAMSDDGLVQVVIERSTPNVLIDRLTGLDAVRRFDRVTFDAVSVPRDAMLGDATTVVDDVERQLQVALVIQLAEMVGAANVAFDFTLEWAFDRYSFGRPLASYQEIKHRFADLKMWLEASHGLATAAARAVEEGRSDAAETVSAAKAYVGQYLPLLMQDCVQLHGGIGLTTDHDLHLFLRRVVVDRSLYGLPADHRRRLVNAAAA
jgi:alkylation response protein AidB-like acyl-CoA dehydrogenase